MVDDLHHIGIAVRDLREATARYQQLGLRLEGIEEVPTEQVRVAVLWAGRTRIELLEATAATSPVARFIDKRGPGIHHVAFKVGSTSEVLRVLVDQGAPVLDREPRPGAHGTRVGFLHPRFLDGVLAELVEDPR